MDYTKSNGYETHAATGNRYHDDDKAIPTTVSAEDHSSVIWSLMEVVKAGGGVAKSFDKAVPATYQQVLVGIKGLIVSHGSNSFVKKDGTGLTGALLAKQGGVTANNTNNAGYAFANDPDTGMFSQSDGMLQFASQGTVVMQTVPGGAVRFSKAVLAPKGMPTASDVSYVSGFAFDGDNDTGLFARGGTVNTGSDVVLVNDSVPVASTRYSDKAFVVETVLVGNCEGASNAVTPYSGAWGETGDLPVNALTVIGSLNFVARGSRCTADYRAQLKCTSTSQTNEAYVVLEIVRVSDGAVIEIADDAATATPNLVANSVGKLVTTVESGQLVKGASYQARVRAYKTLPASVLTLLRNHLRVLTF